jgi:protease-4
MSDETKWEAEAGAAPRTPEIWERDLLGRVLFATLEEQRRARRWGIFFKLLIFAYLLVLLAIALRGSMETSELVDGEHTALVELAGVIAPDTPASADVVIEGLRDAFEDKGTKGVILRINSPGGSPVQAGYINDEITRLRKQYPQIPLYAVITDICASGGYYVAVAADRIYADKASIVGSIGVLMNGFGFVDAMEKIGVERRLLTAGESKGFLDPFSPEKPEDVAHLKGMLGEIHRQFIETVQRGRGERLKADEKLFSGLVWSGARGVELGLVDELRSAGSVARDVIGVEEVVDFTRKEDILERFVERFGTTLARVFTEGATPALR